MTMNLDALERAAIAGTIKWRDAHSLVSLARKLLRLRSAARDFYNSTVANPNLRLSANDKKTRDEAMRAGERLRDLLEATAPGVGDHVESDRYAWEVELPAAPAVPAPIPAAQAVTDDQLVALLPGTSYMDPPDGGTVTLLEQLQRMAKDATRWRTAVRFIGARYDHSGRQIFMISGMLLFSADLMKGSVAEHFTNAIDAEINKGGRKSAPYPAHDESDAPALGDAL